MTEVVTYVEYADKGPGDILTAVPFAFRVDEDGVPQVSVYSDGVLQDNGLYEWIGADQIILAPGFPASSKVLVARETPIDAVTGELEGSSVIDWELINQNFDKAFKGLEEHRDLLADSLKVAHGEEVLEGFVPVMGADGRYHQGPDASTIADAEGAAERAEDAADRSETAADVVEGFAGTLTSAGAVAKGLSSLKYNFSTAVSGGIVDGRVRFDSATAAATTHVRFKNIDADGANRKSDLVNRLLGGAWLVMVSQGTPANFARFRCVGLATAPDANHTEIEVAYDAGFGTFTSVEPLVIEVAEAPRGSVRITPQQFGADPTGLTNSDAALAKLKAYALSLTALDRGVIIDGNSGKFLMGAPLRFDLTGSDRVGIFIEGGTWEADPVSWPLGQPVLMFGRNATYCGIIGANVECHQRASGIWHLAGQGNSANGSVVGNNVLRQHTIGAALGCSSIDYTGGTGGFTLYDTITGATSGCSEIIAAIVGTATSGTLYLVKRQRALDAHGWPTGSKLVDGEVISGALSGSATTVGVEATGSAQMDFRANRIKARDNTGEDPTIRPWGVGILANDFKSHLNHVSRTLGPSFVVDGWHISFSQDHPFPLNESDAVGIAQHRVYNWSNLTSGLIGSTGRRRFNNALASATTVIRVRTLDTLGASIPATFLDGALNGAILRLVSVGDPTKAAYFKVTAITNVDVDHWDLTVSYISDSGSFILSEPLDVYFGSKDIIPNYICFYGSVEFGEVYSDNGPIVYIGAAAVQGSVLGCRHVKASQTISPHNAALRFVAASAGDTIGDNFTMDGCNFAGPAHSDLAWAAYDETGGNTFSYKLPAAMFANDASLRIRGQRVREVNLKDDEWAVLTGTTTFTIGSIGRGFICNNGSSATFNLPNDAPRNSEIILAKTGGGTVTVACPGVAYRTPTRSLYPAAGLRDTG
jgi:hypothetical protein